MRGLGNDHPSKAEAFLCGQEVIAGTYLSGTVSPRKRQREDTRGGTPPPAVRVRKSGDDESSVVHEEMPATGSTQAASTQPLKQAGLSPAFSSLSMLMKPGSHVMPTQLHIPDARPSPTTDSITREGSPEAHLEALQTTRGLTLQTIHDQSRTTEMLVHNVHNLYAVSE